MRLSIRLTGRSSVYVTLLRGIYDGIFLQQRTHPAATTASTVEAPATSAAVGESYFLRLIVHSAEQLPLVKST